MANTATQTAKSKISDAENNTSDMGEDRKQQEIAQLAYSYWEARGGSNHSAEEDWFHAEAELSKGARPKSE